MIKENRIKASKMFWLSLVLLIVSAMFQVFAIPSSFVAGDMFQSVGMGFLWFPLGFLLPLSQLINFIFYDSSTGDTFANVFSLALSLLASFVLLYGARVYAQGKGYHGSAGYLGLIGFAGIAILLIMPDKLKTITK
jgi:hypothetical protein